MTEVVFISGLADKLAYASRLLRKTQRAGERVAVYGPPALLTRLDQLLWTEEERDFLPHLRLRAGEQPRSQQLRYTGVWLLDAPRPELECGPAVSLGEVDIRPLLTHRRVAELVSQDAADVRAGRERWRAYVEHGCQLQHHPQAA